MTDIENEGAKFVIGLQPPSPGKQNFISVSCWLLEAATASASGSSDSRGLLCGRLCAIILEDFARCQHRLPDDRHADIAREVEQCFGQLVLGPPLTQCHAQMQGQFLLTS